MPEHPDQFVNDDGQPCFRCCVCKEVFVSSPDFPEESRMAEMQKNLSAPPDEPLHSACDDCYKKVMAWHNKMVRGSCDRAAKQIRKDTDKAIGVVPIPSGNVLSFTRQEAMEFLGLPWDGKEPEFNEYVQIVPPPKKNP